LSDIAVPSCAADCHSTSRRRARFARLVGSVNRSTVKSG
jgi:hypothetical protein